MAWDAIGTLAEHVIAHSALGLAHAQIQVIRSATEPSTTGNPFVVWIVDGGAGVGDLVKVWVKWNNDVYAWYTILDATVPT